MLKKYPIRLIATLMLCSILAASAHAGAAKTHDGFFLRLSAGAGSAGSKIDDSLNKIDLSGTCGDVNIAIGGMVKPNLAIHGTIFGWSVSDPDADVTLSGLGSGSGTIKGTTTMSAYGAGVTYYFMPINIYASGSAGIGSLNLDGDVNGSSKSGFAMDLTLGKEWWVADSWGLGAAGGFTYHSLPDESSSQNWTGTSIALRFTATFN
jgi:hypothetical protein